MKNFVLTILCFMPFITLAQFGHLKNNEESKDIVYVTMNDNTVKEGVVKNDKMNNGFLRALSFVTTDFNAFNHTNIVAAEILFKENKESSYKSIPSEKIKNIKFGGENGIIYDRISVYKFNRKSLELKNKEVEYMFAVPQVDDVFKVYNKLYLSNSNRSIENDQYHYFAKLKDSEITYFFKFSPFIHITKAFDYFKIFDPKNKEYLAYIDKLKDVNSAERKEYREADAANLEEFIKTVDKNSFSREDYRYLSISRFHNFAFYFIGKKLEQFSN